MCSVLLQKGWAGYNTYPMLNTKANLKIAEFYQSEKPDLVEIKQADVVIFKYRVPSGIYLPENIQWVGDIVGLEKAEDYILSKRARKALKKAIAYFQAEGFTFSVKTMDEALFAEFRDLYNDTTMKKERAIQFDIESAILGRIRAGKEVFAAGMYFEGKLRSALIFSISEKIAVVSFGAKERFPKVRGGVGGVLEYELIKFALERGLRNISHGRATNPAGLVNTAGLFEFKARYGFTAFPVGAWQTMFIKNPQAGLSDLVMLSIANNSLAYLIVSDEDQADLEKKYRTREIKQVIKLDKTKFYQEQALGLKNHLETLLDSK